MNELSGPGSPTRTCVPTTLLARIVPNASDDDRHRWGTHTRTRTRLDSSAGGMTSFVERLVTLQFPRWNFGSGLTGNATTAIGEWLIVFSWSTQLRDLSYFFFETSALWIFFGDVCLRRVEITSALSTLASYASWRVQLRRVFTVRSIHAWVGCEMLILRVKMFTSFEVCFNVLLGNTRVHFFLWFPKFSGYLCIWRDS